MVARRLLRVQGLAPAVGRVEVDGALGVGRDCHRAILLERQRDPDLVDLWLRGAIDGRQFDRAGLLCLVFIGMLRVLVLSVHRVHTVQDLLCQR